MKMNLRAPLARTDRVTDNAWLDAIELFIQISFPHQNGVEDASVLQVRGWCQVDSVRHGHEPWVIAYFVRQKHRDREKSFARLGF